MKERALFACNFKFSTLEREGNWSRKVSRNSLWDRYRGRATNVQCWPQDPYFPFSSLVPHFSEVWKCGKV